MSRQFWNETVFWATSSGSAVANSTTETILFPNVTIPANFMQDGRSLRLRIMGTFSTVVTVNPTMTFAVRWGGVAGTLLGATLPISTSATAITNGGWDLNLAIQTRANGSTGQLVCNGTVSMYPNLSPAISTTAAATTGSADTFLGFSAAYPPTALAPAPVTVDLTADTALAITAKWSAASASTTITGLNYVVEAMN